MLNSNKQQFSFLSTLRIIIFTILLLFRSMPIFQHWFSTEIELCFVIVGVFLLFPIEKNFFNRLFALLPISVLFFLLQNLTRELGFISNLYNVIYGSFVFILIIYLVNSTEENRNILKFLFWVLIISISITQITSIIALDKYPMLARFSIQVTSRVHIDAHYGSDVSAYKLNMDGYGLAYLSPLYTTILYSLMKKKIFHPVLFAIHVALTLYFIFSTQFAIALLLYLIIVTSILLSRGNIKKIALLAIIAFLLLPIFKNPISDFFELLSDSVESDVLSVRFQEISTFLSSSSIKGSDLGARLKAYSESLLVFFKNFFWGGWVVDAYNNLGHHSAILDYIAMSGVWGFFVLILFFRTIYKELTTAISKNENIQLLSLCFTVFIFTALFNPLFYLPQISGFLFAVAGVSTFLREDICSPEETL
ncbi:MAG: hypothetical protein J6J39_00130 [Clostridia bacterium]|nr:hypothetical protein [Clostridia bacterium]